MALRDIEWSTLLFFVGLFVTLEAVVEVGIVGSIAAYVWPRYSGEAHRRRR